MANKDGVFSMYTISISRFQSNTIDYIHKHCMGRCRFCLYKLLYSICIYIYSHSLYLLSILLSFAPFLAPGAGL